MKHIASTALVALLTLSPVTSMAGNGKGRTSPSVQRVVPEYLILAKNKHGHCPPGLAKKAVPCVPPGQVKNVYRQGDRIDRDYIWIDDPYRYGLKRGGHYVRAGDYVYSVDPDTHKVLNLIGAVVDILN